MKPIEFAQLSSKYTPITYWSSIITYIIALPVFAFFVATKEITVGTIVAIALIVFMSWFIYYIAKNLSIAYIKNDEIYLKKMMGKEEKYTYEEIEKVKAYDLGRDGYLVLTMKKAAITKTYLIANTYVWYHGEDDIDAEMILKKIQEAR